MRDPLRPSRLANTLEQRDLESPVIHIDADDDYCFPRRHSGEPSARLVAQQYCWPDFLLPCPHAALFAPWNAETVAQDACMYLDRRPYFILSCAESVGLGRYAARCRSWHMNFMQKIAMHKKTWSGISGEGMRKWRCRTQARPLPHRLTSGPRTSPELKEKEREGSQDDRAGEIDEYYGHVRSQSVSTLNWCGIV